MANYYEEFARALSSATDVDHLRKYFLQLVENAGLNKFTYQIVKHNFHHNLTNFYVTNFDKQWERRYLDQNYFSSDPLVNQYNKNFSAFTWGKERSSEVTETTRQMFDEARQFNLDRGIGIPIPGPNNSFSVLTLCSDELKLNELERVNGEFGKDLMIAALLFHNGVVSLNMQDTMHQGYDLTNKEQDCLKWMCAGKSFSEIAMIESISLSAIKKRTMSLYAKLGVSSRHEAVLKAFKFKVVES